MPTIKFLTLNIFDGGFLFKKVINFLKMEKPDIMVFQEVYNGQDSKLSQSYRTIRVLQDNFKNYYYHFAPEHNDILSDEKILYGNVIFSRYPILASSITFYGIPYDNLYTKEKMNGNFSQEPKNLQYAKIAIGDSHLNILNTHGIWGLHGNDTKQRLAMSKTIVEHIKNKENVVLAGDFNVSPDTETVHAIERYLKNVFKGQLQTTFNMKRKSNKNYANSVVDMIFVSPNLNVVKYYCPDVDISDHLPLICVINI